MSLRALRFVAWSRVTTVFVCLWLVPALYGQSSLNIESDLFMLSRDRDALNDFDDFLHEGIILTINEVLIENILAERPAELHVNIPLSNDTSIKLDLTKVDLFKHDGVSHLVSDPECEIWFDHQTHYWGQIEGKGNSLTAISFSESGLRGLIQFNGDLYNISKHRTKQYYLLYKEQDILYPKETHCETNDNIHWIGKESDAIVTRTENQCVGVYIELDHDLVLSLGSVMEAFDHFAAVFNQVALLYANEGIDIFLSEVLIWDTEDPYMGSSALNNLYTFRDRISGDYNGDIAHLVGKKGSGGVAYIDALCNKFYAVGYSDIKSGYQEIPVYSWAVEVLTHEIGHTLGSKHTHACAWNGNNTAIDGCGHEAGYSEGCEAPIPTKGTIMSYCHLLDDVGIDFSLGFGLQPGNLLREKVAEAGCLSSCSDNPCVITGQPCNDGDVCTIGESYDENCDCIGGVSTDYDGDGFCTEIDPDDNDICVPDFTQGDCDEIYGCETHSMNDLEETTGIWKDGGLDASHGVYSQASSGTHCIRLRDNSGKKSSFYSERLFLQGRQSLEVHFNVEFVSMESGEDLLLEYSNDLGISWTTLDRWISNENIINKQPLFVQEVYDQLELTNEIIVRLRCDASSNADLVYIDDLFLEACAANEGCPVEGLPCDDGDICTEGEVYDQDCQCTGGALQDIDEDGICDPLDDCPNLHQGLIGLPCDDGDICTVDDIFHEDCLCYGEYQDADGDGFCVFDDTDDTDPCIPDPTSPACFETNGDCFALDISDLEFGWGIWKDGGVDAHRYSSNSSYNSSGDFCVRLRDNSGKHSSIYTDELDLEAYQEIEIKFHLYPISMENGESLLFEISYDGGATFITIDEWYSGTDFNNHEPMYLESATVLSSNNERCVLRLQCDASSNADFLYIDDIEISACLPSQNIAHTPSIEKPIECILFPNPLRAESDLNFHFSEVPGHFSIQIMGINGQLISNTKYKEYNENQLTIRAPKEAGTYFALIEFESGYKLHKQLVVY